MIGRSDGRVDQPVSRRLGEKAEKEEEEVDNNQVVSQLALRRGADKWKAKELTIESMGLDGSRHT
jgi:hypothetical protein